MPTIAETSTPQEVFDYVAKHLIKQGRQSFKGTNCLYRGPEGLTCAVGCLLTDEEYQPHMEGTSAYDLRFVLLSPFWSDHQRLLQDLQGAVHDCNQIVEPGIKRKFNQEKLLHQLTAVAKDFNLNTEALNA